VRPRNGRPRGFRADIQALRAVAVSLVVLTHLWPNRLTGGFVGVDIFFVISGYLITAHLVKEIFATSTLSFGRFYARRIRRLLPAAFLVLAVGAVAVALWVPYSEWQATAREMMASALYVENWSLAGQSIDYSAINNQATIAQHYWSLSVEEQFYFVWPLALFGLCWLGSRFGGRRRALFVGIAAVGAASLVYSIVFTAHNPSPAYFVTPVRVWEFAAGALLAVAAGKVSLHRIPAAVLASLGWLGIVVSAVLFGPGTEFPGWAALLPVLGTVAVIAGGTGRTRVPFHSLLGWKPVQFAGDVSYSMYLWHWPMIVVAPYIVMGPLNAWMKLGIVAICVPLAWLTKVFVEDRGKSWPFLSRRPRSTFISMGAGIAILAVLAGSLAWGGTVQENRAEAVQERQLGQPCVGPAALPVQKGCTNALGPAAVTVMGDVNKYYASAPECAVDPNRTGPGVKAVGVCDYTNGKKNATTVWLTGDSHAEQWKPALLQLAKKNHWKLTYSLLGGCPVAEVSFAGYHGKGDPAANAACMTGSKSIARMIEEDRPDKVFYSIFARKEKLDDGSGLSQSDQYGKGLPKFWGRWADAGSTVYVLADPPLNGYVRDAKCVALNPSQPLKCAVPRHVAQPADPLISAARQMNSDRVRLIDLTDHFCDDSRCYAVVGNVSVYFDADHLNGDYSKLLAPFIEHKL